MTPSEIDIILDNVLKMTRQMLVYAQKGNWVDVAKLEGERQRSLMDSLANADVNNTAETGIKIQQIIDVDKETQELVMKARNEIRDDLIQLNKDKDAAKAYGTK